jgi:hypothetical protein
MINKQSVNASQVAECFKCYLQHVPWLDHATRPPASIPLYFIPHISMCQQHATWHLLPLQVESTQEMTRIVGLSATLPNFEDVADFLR